MIYVFPGAEDGSIQIIAATSSGSAVRVVLDRQATKKLASHLSEEVIGVLTVQDASQAPLYR
jgi:hypothetical protein